MTYEIMLWLLLLDTGRRCWRTHTKWGGWGLIILSVMLLDMRLFYLKLDVVMMLSVICQPFRKTLLCFFVSYKECDVLTSQSWSHFSVLCDQALKLQLVFLFPDTEQGRIRMGVPGVGLVSSGLSADYWLMTGSHEDVNHWLKTF